MPKPNNRPRRGIAGDLPELVRLEAACFSPERRESAGVFRRALASPHQEVWVIGRDDGLAAAAIFRLFPRSLRVYSIAVDPGAQGLGLGRSLMAHAEQRAASAGRTRVLLEADAADPRLVGWYVHLGYQQTGLLVDYYAPGRDAIRMAKQLS